jgi:hypothetical protein
LKLILKINKIKYRQFFSSAGQESGQLYQISEAGFRAICCVDQATPGFELGRKDLQSPALPLGHAAKK